MASSEPSERFYEQQQARARLRDLVRAQLWNSVPHHHITEPSVVLPAGSGVTFWDADGRVSGAAPDGRREIDHEALGYVLTHPPEPEPEPEFVPPPPKTDRDHFEEQAALQRWERQFTDRTLRQRAKDALRKRRAYRPSPTGRAGVGAPRKYSDHGALLEFMDDD